ncbi:hypothetical protein CH275_21490 [Rhodococcus sp. 06-235-1A]|uniref:hypothetical protein n=1 Tax=Rhodococcus sp. 06-235-1A TaxID=2022508 RepID=UPI000B9BE893|nr:hypothetical protein [Rhodococcus sp. 06-235-1A]OZD01279.1 hypothetical protein CH275_21490 [Rhodococcus sp. 06-235-1A]
MTTRPDVAALTDEALAIVANRGLLKRALRMVDEQPPALSVSDECITARFADGAVTELPSSTPFDEASCTCGAAAVCRHRIGLVLAYRARHETPSPAESWTPGQFEDADLERHLGAAAVRRARRTRSDGYQARVVRPSDPASAVRVELPHCTVRFLTPHELGHAHSSASPEVAPDSIVLAVWAVRASDELGREDVFVSTAATVEVAQAPAAGRTLARTILLDGVAGTSSVQRAAAARTTHHIQAGRTVWLADACVELTDQLDAYTSRSARHNRTRVARVIGEIHARVELGASADAALAAHALGAESSGETPLRRTVLAGLGARATRVVDGIDVDVYFSELDSDAVYVLRRHWSGENLTGHSVVARRTGGTTVGNLSTSTIVTESAVRRANRRIRLGRRGIGRTSILPLSTEAWNGSPNVIHDYSEARRRFTERRPSFARDRVTTDNIGLIGVHSVIDIDYSPSEQLSTVVISDELGNRAHVVVEHRSEAPGAIDAVLNAMSAGPRTVAGPIDARAGVLRIAPTAVACELGVVVPDLQPADSATQLTRTPLSDRVDAVDNAIAAALGTLADISHRGVRHAAESDIASLRVCAGTVSDAGMRTTGRSLSLIADYLAGGESDAAADAWVRAMLRIMVAEESY